MSFFYVLAVGAAVLGAIFGSFLNALLFRFNTGRGFFGSMGGRSHCMSCGATLTVRDLVPIFSYLFLRGRCRTCGSKISMQYPLVELAAALLSCMLFVSFFPQDSTLWAAQNVVHYAFWLVVWLDILFIVVYDWRHMIIPWSASILLVLLSVALLPMYPPDFTALAAGPLLAAPLFFISLISWGRWMGWADSIFELSLGWILGLSRGATGLLLAIWIGAIVGIGLIALRKSGTMTLKSEIPFGPFLALGAAIAFFFHVDFFATLSLF